MVREKSGVGIALAALMVCTPLAGADAVIVADRELAAIYERNTDEGPGLPRLVSGKIPFIADNAVFATEDIVFFTLEDRVVEFRFDSGVFQQIDTIPIGFMSADLAANTGPNRLALFLYNPSTSELEIREGTRTGIEDSWSFSNLNATLPTLGSTESFSSLEIIQADMNTWAFTHGSNLSLLSRASLASINTIDSSLQGGSALGSRGDGTWTLFWSAQTTEDTVVYDTAGSELERFSPGSAGVFDQHLRSIDWQNTTPSLYGAGRDGVYSAEDPSTGSTVLAQVVSFLTGDGFDASKDISDAADIRRVTGGGWRAYRASAGTIATLDGDTETLSSVPVLERGGGPPLSLMVDFVVDDDRLFVLCGGSVPQAIVEVDRATGSRSVVAALPFLYSGMALQPDGKFLLLRRSTETVDSDVLSFDNIDEVVLTNNPLSPAITSIVTDASLHPARAVLTTPSGDTRLIRWPRENGPVQTINGSNLENLPPYAIETNPVFTNDMGTLVATVNIPDSIPLQQANELYWLFEFTASGTAFLEIRSPDDTVVFSGTRSGQSGLKRRWEFFVDISSILQKNGEWTMRLDNVTPVEPKVAINPRHLARITHAVADAEDSLQIIERHPPRLGRYSTITGGVTRTVIALAGGETFDIDQLNRITSFVSGEESGDFFATNFEDPRVFRIDADTAEAALFITGRPPEVNEDLLGASDKNAGFIVRTGPVLQIVSSESHWSLY